MNYAQLKKLTCVVLTVFLASSMAFAQPEKRNNLRIYRDSVKMTSAVQRTKDFKETFEGKGRNRKSSESVRFKVERLREILDSLASHDVKVIEFKFAIIRAEDVAGYVASHPEQALNEAEQKELIGRPTILIKVPKSIFSPKGSQNNSLIFESFEEESVFLDFGSICPPPESCR